MKLRAKDQVHLSQVKPESLRRGEEFEVSDAAGADLLKARPQLFERVEDVPAEKMEQAPSNKARKPAANKAAAKTRKPAKAS